MTVDSDWEGASRAFFDQRASQITDVNFSDLCFVSGRDPRLWSDKLIYTNMIDHIITSTGVGEHSTFLEVGCASGFLAWGLAPRLRRYVGVDMASRAVETAKRLKLPHADFRVANGKRLYFSNDLFDAAICYDVFTNFPSVADGVGIIREMLRTVRPGGRVLIGSVPDVAKREEYEKRVIDVSAELNFRFGPPVPGPELKRIGLFARIRHFLRPVNPGIVCYYFDKKDFFNLGEELRVSTEFTDIHSMNPYAGYRFNVIYTKSSA